MSTPQSPWHRSAGLPLGPLEIRLFAPGRGSRKIPGQRGLVLAAASLLLAATGNSAEPPVAVSVAIPVSQTGAGHSSAPVFSADGHSVAFLSHAANLIVNDDRAPHLDLFLRRLALENAVLVSVNTNGLGGGNDNVALAALSADARVIAFETAASNLAPGDTNRVSDIFVRDLPAGTTRLASVNIAGSGSGNGRSFNPLLSADGRYVAFESTASDLVTNDFNGTNDIFIRDLATGLTTLISLNAEGTASADGPSHSPSLSSNGLFVAFVSHATNLVTGVTNRLGEIYVRDVAGGSNRWAVASHLSAARVSQTGTYLASQPVLNADGHFVVFKTGSGAVVRFDTQRPTNSVFLSFPVPGVPPHFDFFRFQDNPRLIVGTAAGLGPSPLACTLDGRYAAFATGTNLFGAQYQTVLRVDFESLSTNVAFLECCPGSAGNHFYYDANVTPGIAVVSTNFAGLNAHTNHSYNPVMSADGRRILFLSEAPSSTNTLPDGLLRLYLRDMDTNAPQVISTNRSGRPAALVNDLVPALAPDGVTAAWETYDDDMVAGDDNAAFDVFTRDLTTGETRLVSIRYPERPARTGRAIATIGPDALSADGRRVGFLQRDHGLRPLGTNRWTDGVLRDLLAGTNVLLSAGYALTGPTFPPPIPPTNHSSPPRLSADGRHVAFSTYGSGLFPTNVAWRDLAGGTNRHLTPSGGVLHSLSADGRLFAFEWRSQIGPPVSFVSDGNNASDIMLFSAERRNPFQGTAEFALISVAFPPVSYQTANSASINPILSADGGWVAFQSLATDLTSDPDPAPAAHELFVTRILRDPTNTTIGSLKLVSYTTAASPLVNGTSTQQPIPGGATNHAFSGDGRWLFFDAPASRTIYRHDLFNDWVLTLTPTLGTNNLYHTNRARLTNLTVCADCASPSPDFTGRLVVYESPAGTNALRQIWLRDLASGSNELISVNLAGTGAGNGSSTDPLLSFDARFVVFTSRADDLVAGDTNRASDVFARDRWTGMTLCLSRNFFGTAAGNRLSSHPVLSPDGRTVAFQSFASDLVPGDYNDTRDVFVVTLSGPDTDGDGLEDDWEVAYFNHLARDGSGDFDGDGASDAQEFRAGTDPTNLGSVLRVLTVTTARPSQFFPRFTTLMWSTVPGRAYRVQSKDSLDAPWIDVVGDVPAAGASASWTESNFTPPPGRFYRVRLSE